MMSKYLTWSALVAATFLIGAAALRVIVGPINLSALKDWQPLMAAMIALAAAILAYKGATGRTDLDRDLARRADVSARIGLRLRLSQAAQILAFEMRRKIEEVPAAAYERRTDHKPSFSADELEFARPQEVEEAWSKIEMVPPEAIHSLTVLRVAIQAKPVEARDITFNESGAISGELAGYMVAISKIEERANDLVAVLRGPIAALQAVYPRLQ